MRGVTRVKVFSVGSGRLEETLRTWLLDHPDIEIAHLAQSQQGMSAWVLVTVLYRQTDGEPETP